MTRSKWKIPFTDTDYFKKTPNKISRDSKITPKLIGATVNVHNGKILTELIITKEMLGHKCGEFSLTRSKFSFKNKKSKK